MPQDKDYMNLLEQDAQLRRKVSRMVPPDGPLEPRHVCAIKEALQNYASEYGLSLDDVVRGIGQKKISVTYLSNFLNDTGNLPPEKRDEIARAADAWIDRDARARACQRNADFVATQPAERLINIADRLMERCDMALAYGPAGIGKTTTLDAITAERPAAYKITCGHDTRIPSGLLRAIYKAVAPRRTLPAVVRVEHIVERTRKPDRIATFSVWMFDQAHLLTDREFPLLAELNDAAQVSILLVGTVDLRKRIASDDDPEFGQVSSRFGMRINLAPELTGSLPGGKTQPLFTVAEIRKLFGRGKIKLHSSAARMLARIANEQRGTLRRVMRLYDWAEVAAQNAGADEITVEHIEAAAQVVEADALVIEPIETVEVAEGVA
jgi:DNA transposition AAA+ family ATPase